MIGISAIDFYSTKLPDRHCEQMSTGYIIKTMNNNNCRMTKLHGTRRMQRGKKCERKARSAASIFGACNAPEGRSMNEVSAESIQRLGNETEQDIQ